MIEEGFLEEAGLERLSTGKGRTEVWCIHQDQGEPSRLTQQLWGGDDEGDLMLTREVKARL